MVVSDPGRWEWELVLRGSDLIDFRMRSMTTASRLKKITKATLRDAPVDDLLAIARLYINRLRSHRKPDEGLPPVAASELAAIKPGEARLGRPTPEEFAEAWAESRDQARHNRRSHRNVLAERYSVSVWAIDKWVRNARDLGLIPRAEKGRGNKAERTE